MAKKKTTKPAVKSKAAEAPASAAPKVGPVQYVGQVRQEARKVVWPTWRETLTTTVLVMIMVVLMGLFFFVVDFALANVLELMYRLFGLFTETGGTT